MTASQTSIRDREVFLLSKHRLEGLADGVFAIVMTLLVLDLKAPDLARGAYAAIVAGSGCDVARLLQFLRYVRAFFHFLDVPADCVPCHAQA